MESRTIPESLLPDARNQFLVIHPHPDDDWMAFDSWTLDVAVKLITLGYPVDLESKAAEVKGYAPDAWGRDQFSAMVSVYMRARAIAESSVSAGTIRSSDTPANWIEWALGKGYSVEHLSGLSQSAKAGNGERPKAVPVQRSQAQDAAILDQIRIANRLLGEHRLVCSPPP